MYSTTYLLPTALDVSIGLPCVSCISKWMVAYMTFTYVPRCGAVCELSLDPEVATLFGREIGQSNGDILLTICDDSKDKSRPVTFVLSAVYSLFYVLLMTIFMS
jgi:hypothetical protein